MKVTFDGENRLIIVNEGVTELDVQVDLYSAWKNWKPEKDESKWLPAMRGVGGDSLPGDRVLGDTYFLMNGWRIRPFEGDHVLRVFGNLFTEEGESPFVPTLGDFNVRVELSVSSLVDTKMEQLPAAVASSVWDAITADHQTEGTTGKALSDAQAAGNPWAAQVSENTTPGTFGELVGKKLLTVAKFLGLK